MTQEKEQDERIEEVRSFLRGYLMCQDMLQLRRYERKRAARAEMPEDLNSILLGNEAFWRCRMYQVKALIAAMRNGREKLMLYYHYMAGESIEHAANLLDVSRRTGYRMHERGLRTAAALYQRMQKKGEL